MILIIRHEHQLALHGGYRLIHAIIRTKLGVINETTIVKAVTRKCITGFKANARPSQQLMEEVPSKHIHPVKPGSSKQNLSRSREVAVYAAVKSMKRHLTKMIGAHLLKAKMYTLLVVGACLNSRLLAPINTDSCDIDVLLPYWGESFRTTQRRYAR